MLGSRKTSQTFCPTFERRSRDACSLWPGSCLHKHPLSRKQKWQEEGLAAMHDQVLDDKETRHEIFELKLGSVQQSTAA